MRRMAVRRKDKEVTDGEWMREILKRGQVMALAMAEEDGWPYVVYMGYGYDGEKLYVHGAVAGKKNEILAENPRVCFQVALDMELVRSDAGVQFTWKYRSVTGYGHLRTLTDLDEKNKALEILMKQYDGPHTALTPANHERVWVACIEIEELTGKSGVYPKP